MRLIAVAFVAFIVAACGWNTVTPANNPESRDYPCGPRGIVCSGSYPNAMCCWRGDICGSGAPFSTCPAGYCCAEDIDEGSYGFTAAKWQWKATDPR